MNVPETIQQINSVLVLDDDVLQAKALSLQLKKSGFKITGVVHTGVQAIASAKQEAPNIALLDINLFGQPIDGIEVGNALQALYQNIIIIYITAYGNDVVFKKALDSKPYAFIEKPYQMKTLQREIEMAVQKVVQLKEKTNLTTVEFPLTKQNHARLLCFPNCILLKDNGEYQKILLKDIFYLKADGMYTNLITRDKKILATILLKDFEQEFQYPSFLRTHNSFMVNLANVETVQVKKVGGKLFLPNEGIVPVSKGYVDRFWLGYQKYMET